MMQPSQVESASFANKDKRESLRSGFPGREFAMALSAYILDRLIPSKSPRVAVPEHGVAT